MIGNLLALAQSVIGTHAVTWAKFTGRAENAAGYEVATYAAPVPLEGATVQPVPQKLFQLLGLDWNKEYVHIYARADVVTVGRDNSGDKIIWNGKTYLAESDTDWFAQAGFVSFVAVRVPA